MDLHQLINSHYLEAVQLYPGLKTPVLNGSYYNIEGSVEVVDANGYNWGLFQVRIKVPIDYPGSLPILEETGGQIPRTKNWDWHVGENGECCVGTPAQQFRILLGKMTLLNWLNCFVVPFFANYIHKRDLKEYVKGEFSHGVTGLLEDYSDVFDLKDKNSIVERLSYITGSYHPMNKKCFCGSGKLYKRCYIINKEIHLLGIPKELLLSDLKRIRKIQP